VITHASVRLPFLLAVLTCCATPGCGSGPAAEGPRCRVVHLRRHGQSDQPGLFGHEPSLPQGFKYWPEFLSREEERELVRLTEALPLESFQFHGFTGKRRVVSFGWRYDFNGRELRKADDMPPFLLPLREWAAARAGLGPSDFQHVLVTEYAPGAGIGWHRDKAVFDEVVGISLLAACDFRFRRKKGNTWERATVRTEPRSAYLLSGAARTEWEHSIPALDRLEVLDHLPELPAW
jgi:alkylated DNA repair dioxygenase AlkB